MPIENQDKYYTELDKELQQLALIDWPTFVKIVGPENILSAKICILKRKGNSQAQIANRLNVTKNQSEYACKKCS